jgi:XTP/dITP diphosphohydrolase
VSTLLWLASNNPKKLAEMQRLLAPLDCEIRTPAQLKAPFDPVEDQPTFAGNARKKAMLLATTARGLALADDSGLCVDVLGGRPGVLSARYGGPELDDRGRMLRLLESLRAVPPGQRQAHFTCHLCLCGADGKVLTTVEERCEGTLLEEPSGEGGFGYDPIFVPREYGTDPTRSFANLDATNKDRVSHRGKALRSLLLKLPKVLRG